MTTTKVRDRVTHHLDLGVTEDVGTKAKHVHCVYPNKQKVYGPKAESMSHPATVLSVSMQDDIVWTSDQPFRIDLKPGKEARQLFFRPLPWYSIESALNGSHRVHSGAMDPDALPLVKAAKGAQIELKFTVTPLDSTEGPQKKGVGVLDPHVIVEP